MSLVAFLRSPIATLRSARWFASRESDTRRLPDGAYCNAVDLESIDEGDDWILIVPLGENPNHPDGPHEVTQRHVEQMASNFDRMGTDLLIDRDHESVYGGSTQAMGWSPEVEAREDGLYMRRPDWTDAGEELVASQEFRYLSPVYMLEAEDTDGRQIGAVIDSVAITNRPYFRWGEIDPIGNSDAPKDPSDPDSPTDPNDVMDREQLIEELGLDEDATDEDILNAIRQNQNGTSEEGDEEDPEEGTEGEEDPAAEEDEGDGSEGEGSEAEEEDLEAKVNSILDRKLQERDQKRSAERLVDEAVEDGKIRPSQREVYLNSARDDYEGTKEVLDDMDEGAALPKSTKVSNGRSSVPSGASENSDLREYIEGQTA